jgi:hypothetical protein
VRWTAVASTVLALGALAAEPAVGARTTDRYAATHGRAVARWPLELVLGAGGRVHFRSDRFTPPPQPPPPAPAAHPSAGVEAHAAKAQRSFTKALRLLRSGGAIGAAAYDSYLSDYQGVRHSLTKLRGTRRAELGAVVANLEAIAARGQLTASRLPALMLTLERNRQWWTTGPLLASGQYVSFPGSLTVWEYYPGQGIELQWLANFGKANGYYLSGTHDAQLGALLDELVPLAAQRAGGIAWEYEFRFDGGAPPWVSGLSQGTAIQALARAAVRLDRPDYLAAARSALGIFEMPAPQGVRAATAAGAHYLEYSFAPRERILNGFIQALVGLYDFASLASDPLGWTLFEAGDAEARLEVPSYDTGAWSLYDQTSESNLNYHELVTGFLGNLCQRTQQGVPGEQTATSGGGAPASPQAAPPGDQIYCVTAQRFGAYLHEPPSMAFAPPPRSARARRPLRIAFTLSKISSVTLTIAGAKGAIAARTLLLGHGARSLKWIPAKPGSYVVKLRATDLAGNTASVSERLLIGAPKPPKRG